MGRGGHDARIAVSMAEIDDRDPTSTVPIADSVSNVPMRRVRAVASISSAVGVHPRSR
jgi:hypothetical protein